MDWSNPTLGWSEESFDDMLSGGEWTSLDSSLESSVTWSDGSSSSSSSYGSSSEWISSDEWTTSEEESSMSLSAWFIDTEDSWPITEFEPQSMSEEALRSGVTGYFEIDHALYPSEQDRNDWHHVEINWNHGSFTWENRAGISWTLTPIRQPIGGDWDYTKLQVGSDNIYYNEGYHFATLEWVSSE